MQISYKRHNVLCIHYNSLILVSAHKNALIKPVDLFPTSQDTLFYAGVFEQSKTASCRMRNGENHYLP